ncbi:nicotinate phosphoribosyltransferase [Anopheles sinensis]|uniref:Nicotinate phosphoribosyltransferase n=1 Tax=Anopheles sinensis TaxID=74873 RepID=A0A084WSN9_ANOSI|nr:nicotinate phosphoribosyltransferase [Anopheles sinensis]
MHGNNLDSVPTHYQHTPGVCDADAKCSIAFIQNRAIGFTAIRPPRSAAGDKTTERSTGEDRSGAGRVIGAERSPRDRGPQLRASVIMQSAQLPGGEEGSTTRKKPQRTRCENPFPRVPAAAWNRNRKSKLTGSGY